VDYTSNTNFLLPEEYENWFQFFRNKSKWICVDDKNWNDRKSKYFTYGKKYDLDYIDYENNDVYIILDNGRDDIPISFNTLINCFVTIEDFRESRLKEIGI
jgi:hypothetical protein